MPVRVALTAVTAISLFTFAISTTAALAVPVHDPACDKYGNAFGIYDQKIDTPYSHTQHEESDLSVSGLFCGSEIDIISLGWTSLITQIDITVPAGMTVYYPYDIPNGRYVGQAKISVLGWRTTQPELAENETVTIYSDRLEGTDCIDWNHICYKGVVSGPIPGKFWIVGNTDLFTGRLYKLSIKEFYPSTNYGLWGGGYTKISDLRLCTRAGHNNTACGDAPDDLILQRNGDVSAPSCENGNGIFTLVSQMRNGSTSRSVTSCVEWEIAPPSCGTKCKQFDIGGTSGPVTGGNKQSSKQS